MGSSFFATVILDQHKVGKHREIGYNKQIPRAG